MGQSGWRRILALFALATFVEVIAYGQLAAFTPLHLPRIGVPDDQVAFWVGAITVGANALGLLFLPFWGALADRYGRKLLIIRSFAATGAGLAVAALATNVWQFLGARALTALNLGNSGLMMTTLAEGAPASRIGFAYGVVNGAGPLGALAGPLIGGPLVDRYGFAAILAIDAALLAGVVLLMTVGYRDPYVRPADPPPILRSAFGGVALLWRSQRLRALFPALVVLFAGWMLVFIYSPLAIAQIHRGPDLATAIGLVLGAGGVVTLVASPGIGALADRLGLMRTYYVVGALSAAAWILPWLTRDYVPFLIGWAIANGLGSGLFSLSFNVLTRSTTDTTRARVMTFSYLPPNLGFIVGPAIGSVVASTDPFAIFPTAVVLELIGLALVAVALRRPLSGSVGA
jgi:DHA1 family multidrug resistance protein-like MFS transporter